ncbi:MAG: tRNA pseudouridine(13) synthase TruD [Candidatus Diapherotrites archaeon]
MQENFYSTSTPGIKGRIKQRIADFNVKEIGLNGKVCGITLDEKKLSEFMPLIVPENPEKKDYLILTMEKFNLDLNEAIKRIARFNYLSHKRISYAGMKDKRAITSQKISFYRPDPERLEQFKSKFVRLREPEWSEKKIEIGDLNGNIFEITVRDIELSEIETKKRLSDCIAEMKEGIANYFGEQRFGGVRQVTHLVGKEFVRGNFEGAVMLYLTRTSEREEAQATIARENLKTSGNFSRAVKEFPVKYSYERAILNYLIKKPEDFIGAFRVLPKGLRYLFVHAFQAFLFNKVINERIKEGIGLKAVEGDVLIEGFPSAPLYGFETVFASGKAGEIEKKVLGEEGLSLKQFYVKDMKEMSSKGARKKIILIPKNLKLLEVKEDEFNEGKLKAIISFELNKGDYATTVLRELMKNE